MRYYTIKDFDRDFPNDDACLAWLWKRRYGERLECPNCKRLAKYHRVRGRKAYECDYCGNQISPMAGTVLQKSPTPMKAWFRAVFLMATTRTGVSAKHLQRELGVTYKTAWRMFTEVRKLMSQDGKSPLFGKVEVDETYIGGRRHGKRGRGAAGKTIVMGMVEREGKTIAKVVPNTEAKTLLPIIQQHIPVTGTTTIFTDEFPSYKKLTSLGYGHEVVNHAAKEYVRGTAHVNSVEAVWSNVKRGIDGAHHAISPKYLQSYVDSYVFKLNHRNDEQPMFLVLLNQIPSSG